MKWRSSPALIPLLLAGAACTDTPATSIMLALRVDDGVAKKIDHTEVTVYRPSESAIKWHRCFPASACEGSAGGAGGAGGHALWSSSEIPGTLALYPDDKDDTSTPLLVVVEGKLGAETRISRRARLSFVKEKSKLLRLGLSAACLPVDCSKAATGQDDLTCDRGQCVSTTISNPDELPTYTDDSSALDSGQFASTAGAGGQGGAGAAGMGGDAGMAGMAGVGGDAGMAGMGGSAGMAGMAGMAGSAGMAGMGGMDPCGNPAGLEVSFLFDHVVSGAAEPTMMAAITVKGGVPPYQYKISTSQQPTIGSIPKSGVATQTPLEISYCTAGAHLITVTDQCQQTSGAVPLVSSSPFQVNGPYVSIDSCQAEACGTKAQPWCDIQKAIDSAGTDFHEIRVAATATPLMGPIVLKNGVSLVGGYSPDFSTIGTGLTVVKATPDLLVPSAMVPFPGVVRWPEPDPKDPTATLSLKNFLVDVDWTGAQGSLDQAQIVAIPSSANAVLENVTVGHTDAISNASSVAAIRGIQSSDATDTLGSIKLLHSRLLAPNAGKEKIGLRTRSVGIQTIQGTALDITGGTINSGTPIGPGEIPVLSVGVEHLARGHLTLQGDTATQQYLQIQSAAASGGLSIGVRVTRASIPDANQLSVLLDTVEIRTSQDAVTKDSCGVVFGDISQLSQADDYSPGTMAAATILPLAIKNSKIMASSGTAKTIGLLARQQVQQIDLSDSVISASPLAGPVTDSSGIAATGGGTPMVLNISTTRVYGGGAASNSRLGAELRSLRSIA
jgi:hypothetical protein